MLDNGKISSRQFMVLVFLYVIGTTVLVVPSGMAATAKQDAWLGALAGVAIGMGLIWLYISLWRLYPNLDFIGICHAALGRVLGTGLAIVYAFYAFIGAATVLYYVGNFFRTQFLPSTPFTFIVALFALMVVMGLRLGLETVARASELMLPWFLILYVVLVVTLLPEIKFERVLPVFDLGWKPIFGAGLSFACTAYMPLVFLFSVLPDVDNPNKIRTPMLVAASVGGLCVVLVTLLCIMILGPSITARSMFPSYALVKKINIGNFFQRIEVILAGLWFITTYIKTTFYFYSWVRSSSRLMKVNNYKVLTLPFGMILVVFSQVVYPNVIFMQHWDSTVFLPYMMVMGLLIPCILLAAGKFRKRQSSS